MFKEDPILTDETMLQTRFYYQNTVRGDSKKTQHPELWSLHATHLFNLMYNSTKYHQRIFHGA